MDEQGQIHPTYLCSLKTVFMQDTCLLALAGVVAHPDNQQIEAPTAFARRHSSRLPQALRWRAQVMQ